jgi:hypothetical protein
MIPEKIIARITNCSTITETVTAGETTAGPMAVVSDGTSTRTFTLAAGQTAKWVRYKQYVCCGTFNMTLKVYQGAGLLAKATTTWTDA